MKTIKLIKLTTLFLGAVSILSIIETCTKKIESNNQTNEQDSTEYTGHKPIEISLDGSSYSKSFLIKSDQEGVIETTSSTGTKYKFAIPKNAVLQNDSVRITITPIINVKNLPQHKKFLAAVQFEPEGLALLKPAILTIIFPEAVPQDSLVSFSYQGAGNDFHLIPIAHKDSILSPIQSISLSILHFSGVIVGLGTLSDCANQGYPTNPESIYEQGIACVFNDAASKTGHITPDDINQLHNILIAWFDQLVLPKLNSATNLNELKDIIKNSFLRWMVDANECSFILPDDFLEQFNSAGVPIKALLEKDLSKLNIDCSNETDPCKLIQYFKEYQEWQSINQSFFQAVNINIDFLDLNNFCGGNMLTTITQVKIKIPKAKDTTMNTIDSITFNAELKNGLNQPIDGKVSWLAIPVGSVNVGGFRDNFTPTFYGLREGETFIIASAVPVGSSNPLDCVKDTVRVKVSPDCNNKPLQPGCHSIWEGTVQFPSEFFESCNPNACDCNGNCLHRWYFSYDLKFTLEVNVSPDDFTLSYSLGTMHVTGIENVNYIYCSSYHDLSSDLWSCISSNSETPIDETNGISGSTDITQVFYFNPIRSYNDFRGSFHAIVRPWGFGYHGSIKGNSGSLTISNINETTDGSGNTTDTNVNIEVVLNKISK